MTGLQEILFIGGPRHGQVHLVYADSSNWRMLTGGAYERRTVYHNGPDLPDFFEAMVWPMTPESAITDALDKARATNGWKPTYTHRAIDGWRP